MSAEKAAGPGCRKTGMLLDGVATACPNLIPTDAPTQCSRRLDAPTGGMVLSEWFLLAQWL